MLETSKLHLMTCGCKHDTQRGVDVSLILDVNGRLYSMECYFQKLLVALKAEVHIQSSKTLSSAS